MVGVRRWVLFRSNPDLRSAQSRRLPSMISMNGRLLVAAVHCKADAPLRPTLSFDSVRPSVREGSNWALKRPLWRSAGRGKDAAVGLRVLPLRIKQSAQNLFIGLCIRGGCGGPQPTIPLFDSADITGACGRIGRGNSTAGSGGFRPSVSGTACAGGGIAGPRGRRAIQLKRRIGHTAM